MALTFVARFGKAVFKAVIKEGIALREDTLAVDMMVASSKRVIYYLTGAVDYYNVDWADVIMAEQRAAPIVRFEKSTGRYLYLELAFAEAINTVYIIHRKPSVWET